MLCRSDQVQWRTEGVQLNFGISTKFEVGKYFFFFRVNVRQLRSIFFLNKLKIFLVLMLYQRIL